MAAGIYLFEVGDLQCIVAADHFGASSFRDLLGNPDLEQEERVAHQLGLPIDRVSSDSKCLLIRTGQHTVLVDAGFGTRSAPVEGQLLANLATVGIGPGDIDIVAITHADRDHISGLLDAAGRPAFPSARYVMWKGAHEYWASPQSTADWSGDRAQFVRQTYAAIESRLDLVEGESEFLPGFQLIPAVGHKRDHTAVRIASLGQTLWHLADAVAHPLFLAHGLWYFSYDLEPARALETKRILLERAAAEDALVFGAHFPFPGVGTVRSEGANWAWEPV